MTLGGVTVADSGLADAFAVHFNNKVRSSVSLARIDPDGVYNSKCQLIVQYIFFMDKADAKSVLTC